MAAALPTARARKPRFHGANGTAIDSAGNIYVADSINAVIRKVTPGGVVTTLAGQPQVHGHADGPASSAMFFGPNALAIDGSGNLYAGDGWRIRKTVWPQGWFPSAVPLVQPQRHGIR